MLSRLTKSTLIIGLVLLVLSSIASTGHSRPGQVSLNLPLSTTFPYQAGFPKSAGDDVSGRTAPLVADVDNDGKQELFLPGRGLVYGWDYLGQPLPGFPVNTGDGKIVASLAAADLDNNGDLEILAGTSSEDQAHNRARVFVWDHTGAIFPGWPQNTQWNSTYAPGWAWNEVTSLTVADIDGNGDQEVLATTTASTAAYNGSNPPPAYNAYAWHHNGTPVSGWPNAAGPWPAYDSRVGIYGLIAAGDFDGNQIADAVLPRDYNILFAYNGQGQNLSANWPLLVFYDPSGTWGQDEVGFGVSAPVLADLNQDGITELINVGIRNTASGVRTNSAVMVFEPDGSRFPGWSLPALGSGWKQPQTCSPYGSAIVANLDSDPELEIIASTNDGYVRAYEPNKTLKWAFNYSLGHSDIIAGELAAGDVDGDNQVDIVFGTHQINFNATTAARIWALNGNTGATLSSFPLTDIGDRNIGVCAAPALADLDDDGDVELIVNRKADTNQLAVWDLPGTYHPFKMPWPQGRHDAQRTGTYKDPAPNLNLSKHFSSGGGADFNELAQFSLLLRNSGGTLLTDTITVTVQLPAELINPQNITLNPSLGGTLVTTASGFTWKGILDQEQRVTFTYEVQVNTNQRLALNNLATIEHPIIGSIDRIAVFITNPLRSYLPLIMKN